MTLNEIIAYAKEQNIDFDAEVVGKLTLNFFVPFGIRKCDRSYTNKLLLEAEIDKKYPACHVAFGYKNKKEE